MRKFLATTALAALMATGTATGALAAAHGSMFVQERAKGDMRASEFIGMRLYAAEVENADNLRIGDNKMLIDGDVEREWEDVGEINDVLMTRDGDVTAVLIDVGGFLGIGEKTVAVSMDQIKFVSENDEGEAEYFLVIDSTEEELENAPEFQTAMMDGDIMDNEQEEGDMTGQTAAAEAEAEIKEETAEAEMEVKEETTEMSADARAFPPTDWRLEGYDSVEVSQLTAEDLDGARVYGIGDEDVGEISELLLTDDGKIEAAVIDVGGFLGIGEKPVKVSFDQLSIQRATDGGYIRVYIDASEESLEALPGYNS